MLHFTLISSHFQMYDRVVVLASIYRGLHLSKKLDKLGEIWALWPIRAQLFPLTLREHSV